jgi:hypothetical protein
MSRQFKLMILVNIMLAASFLICNYVYFYFVNRFDGHAALWSPISLTFINMKEINDVGSTIGVPEPNFSFYFFWIVMVFNVYFLYRLQKSANTTQ